MSHTPADERTDTPTNSTDRHEARVNRDGNGDPLGAAMFLSGEELQDLGIDPNETDRVAYAVRDGRLRVVGEELDTAADSGAGE
jgi:hypothetical protein